MYLEAMTCTPSTTKQSMDPVKRLSPRWMEEYLSQLYHTLNPNAKQTLKKIEKMLANE
jgi:hypothetical protein